MSIAASRGPGNPTPDTNPAAWSLIAAAGTAGPAGPQGTQGVAGPSGPEGPTGPSGSAGAAGATGATGPAGPTGPTGTTGPIGPMGPTGSQGAQGPQGPGVGFTYLGAFDPTATYAVNDAVTYAGSTYVSIAASRGPGNPTPDTNPAAWSLIAAAGTAGPAGPQGTQGTQGVAGPSGPEGPAGPSGSTGAAGATGATGPAGPAGPTGPQGPAGAPGNFGAGVNALTTSYATVAGDNGSLITMNGSSLTLTLPSPALTSPWYIGVQNLNASNVTIVSSAAINGSAANTSLWRRSNSFKFGQTERATTPVPRWWLALTLR